MIRRVCNVISKANDHVCKVISDVLGHVINVNFKVIGRVVDHMSNVSEDWPCGKGDLCNMTGCVIRLTSQIAACVIKVMSKMICSMIDYTVKGCVIKIISNMIGCSPDVDGSL